MKKAKKVQLEVVRDCGILGQIVGGSTEVSGSCTSSQTSVTCTASGKWSRS